MDFDFIDDSSPFDDDGLELETARQLETPKIKRRSNIAKREFISGMKKEALTSLIQELPPEDTDLYIVGNGAGGTFRLHDNPNVFEFGHFIPVLVEMLGNKGVTLFCSTWTMNRQHGLNMLSMLDDGRLTALTLFTDTYWKRREAAVANEIIAGLMERNQTYLSFKNHVKCIALANADHTRFVTVTGSANLSAQPRAENYTLTTHPAAYLFYRDEFFLEMLKRG